MVGRFVSFLHAVQCSVKQSVELVVKCLWTNRLEEIFTFLAAYGLPTESSKCGIISS